MQTVVNISLNGNSYQLEEPGFIQLRAYLERAEARLKDNPDRVEVMGDLEQAIGEKCRGTLTPHKTVVTVAEVERIIAEMGPVEPGDEKAAGGPDTGSSTYSASPTGGQPRKRLYKIREGAMWGGVCNGLAAYMGLDVTWVRIGLVVLTIFTGVTLLVYLAMLLIVPYADTAEDRAAAFGVPFNTEDIISRAKKNFDESNHRWHAEWRRQQRHWNKQFRDMNAQLRQTVANVAPNMGTAPYGIMAVFLPIAAIVGAVLFVGWILALFSLITQHTIFGWGLPHGMPLWIGMLLLFLAYVVVSAPLKAIRHGAHRGAGHHPAWGALHSLLWIGFTAVFFWVAYHWFPGVRELVDSLMWAANLTVETISETIV
jgi:phage shock protein PspC (stress-responsive transcriptional regulator)